MIKIQFFGYFLNMVSPIELIPSPWVVEFQYATVDVQQPTKIKTSKFELQ